MPDYDFTDDQAQLERRFQEQQAGLPVPHDGHEGAERLGTRVFIDDDYQMIVLQFAKPTGSVAFSAPMARALIAAIQECCDDLEKSS